LTWDENPSAGAGRDNGVVIFNTDLDQQETALQIGWILMNKWMHSAPSFVSIVHGVGDVNDAADKLRDIMRLGDAKSVRTKHVGIDAGQEMSTREREGQ